MKSPSISSARAANRWLVLIVSALGSLFASEAFAQLTATGTIAGRVYEQATGKSLQGAIVRVAGATSNDYTDAEGRFSLPGVPAGMHIVEVEYVGLDFFKQQVAVHGGATTTLNAGLASEVLKMATFEVAEAARGQALAINQQKTARGIVNIVSEETFGAMNEGNIGYVLQRLPGISVNENEDGSPEGANIRGLPSEFNAFTIDGNRVGNRGFNTRTLVADGVSNIEVIKAATPDRDGDAIGGTINVVSRSAFQRDGREIRLSASTTYVDLADKWGYNGKVTFTDLFGIFGETKNLGVSVTASKYLSNRYYTNNDTDWISINRANNPTYNLPSEVFYYMPNATSQYNLRETNQYGLNASIDFRTGPNHSFYFKPLYTHYDIVSSRYLTRPYLDNGRFQDAINGRKTFEFLNYNGGRTMAGTNGGRGEMRYSAEEADTHTDLWSFGGGGRHELGTATLTYDLFTSRSHYTRTNDSDFIVRNVPVAKGYFQYEYDVSNRLYPKVWIVNGLDPRDLSGINRGNLSIEPEDKVEDIETAKIDFEKKFVRDRVAGALKFGVKYHSSAPSFDQGQFEYQTTADFPYASVMKSVNRVIHGKEMFMEVEPRKVRALLQAKPELFPYLAYESAKGAAEEDYDAKETTKSAYGMGTLQIGRATIVTGLRVEKNSWRSMNKEIDALTVREKKIYNGKDYTLWLPGLHGRIGLRPNLILRASYNRSYGRPTLSRLTLGKSTDATGNISVGNPFLDPTTSHNFDMQIEQYTQKGGLYSLGVFYKKMQGFYYQSDRRFNTFDAAGEPIIETGGVLRYRKWENANGALNYGVELIAQQKLHFLPGPLQNLSAFASATFTKSDAKYPSRPNDKLPTFGFSKGMFNASMEYAQSNFRGKMSYRYRTAYLSAIGVDKYADDIFAAREQIDAEMSYRLRKNLRLIVSGDNLTSRPQVSYQGFPIYPEDNSNYGWRATFGAEYTF